MSVIEIVAMIVCFGCIITISLSDRIIEENKTETTTEVVDEESTSEENNLSMMILGCSLMFLTAWIFATSNVLNRSLKGVHHAIIIFWHGLFGFTVSLAVALVQAWVSGTEVKIFHLDGMVYLFLIGAAMFDTLATTSSTIAY